MFAVLLEIDLTGTLVVTVLGGLVFTLVGLVVAEHRAQLKDTTAKVAELHTRVTVLEKGKK